MIEANSWWLDSLLPYGALDALNLLAYRATVMNSAERCWRPERRAQRVEKVTFTVAVAPVIAGHASSESPR
jgi:hypothetical protein